MGILLLLVTGCGQTQAEEKMVCTRTVNMNNIEMDLRYEVYYEGDNVNKVQSTEKVISDDEATLQTYQDQVESIYSNFDNVEHYDYEVSIEEIDFLVDTIYKFGSGKAAARITGGGFGGCVVALVQKGYAEQLHREVIEAYKEKYGIDAEVYFTKAANGAQYLPITKL